MQRLCTLALLLGLLPCAHATEPLEVGDTFPAFEAKDQHDDAYRFEPGTRAVLIAFDMATGKAANRALAAEEPGFLEQHRAAYVSNIHGMPGIGRIFAIPKMRKYPHRIVLADGEHLLDAFPRADDHVTVLRLSDEAVIESIEFWNPGSTPLREYLH